MRAVELIEKKRSGGELTREELEYLVIGYTRGEVPDYQAAAWLMAVCWRGMSKRELFDLTAVMAASGATLDLSGVGMPVADKHSSGGVGDKTSLVVAPLVRACDVAVGKMSGRGLGFTGGTIDKLESIPGFRVDLTAAEFVRQLEREGIVLSSQAPDLAPADGRLYALRDVTATVACIPLIASSIMSKKLAVGAQALVLDVKVGSGAFMSRREEAAELARLMVEIGKSAGKRVAAILSPMEEPLGQAVGNALEVSEAIRMLRGDGPADLVELCTGLAGEMLFLAGQATDAAEGKKRTLEVLSSGKALLRLEQLIRAQGGDLRVLDRPELMGVAPVVRPVPAPRAGWVSSVDARRVATAVLNMGGGRARKGDAIDHRVGVSIRRKVGSEVAPGDLLAEVHAASEGAAESAVAEVAAAYGFSEQPSKPLPVLLERYL